jgi:hypothetical protein
MRRGHWPPAIDHRPSTTRQTDPRLHPPPHAKCTRYCLPRHRPHYHVLALYRARTSLIRTSPIFQAGMRIPTRIPNGVRSTEYAQRLVEVWQAIRRYRIRRPTSYINQAFPGVHLRVPRGRPLVLFSYWPGAPRRAIVSKKRIHKKVRGKETRAPKSETRCPNNASR